MKYVIVPQEDIDKLEKARKSLCAFLEQGKDGVGRFYPETFIHITQPMWEITHRKYLQMKTYKDIIKFLPNHYRDEASLVEKSKGDGSFMDGRYSTLLEIADDIEFLSQEADREDNKKS